MEYFRYPNSNTPTTPSQTKLHHHSPKEKQPKVKKTYLSRALLNYDTKLCMTRRQIQVVKVCCSAYRCITESDSES
ncbi:hypothetical protein EYC84_008564 [Monilinia fructicola]|uniref:Uncharacterized protein n=1 Tax=Monilinia fructicola TaxID=38448 RepID=A0A5M9JJM8_MONFR|nr:hypothetical protein EYC84_008564 [Monilinia fructicola]